MCADVMPGDGIKVGPVRGGKFMVKLCIGMQGKVKSLRHKLDLAKVHLADMEKKYGIPKGSVELEAAKQAYTEAMKLANSSSTSAG